LKVSFGLLEFGHREYFVTDGSYDGDIDGYYINNENRMIYFIQSKCLHFLQSRITKPTHDLDKIIWTKTILLAGLESEMFNLQIPKEFYDFVSEFPLGQLNTSHIKPFSFKTNIADLNRDKLIHHQSKSKSFDELFLFELARTLDANRTRLDPIHPRLVEFIFDQYNQKRITSELPHFRIFPTLFASAMQNKQLKFKENDTMDYFHATCALPFFDYFFTEKTLHNTIHQRKLDVRFSCQVESNHVKIIQMLKLILQD
jgi:hypothetical protein